MTKVLIITLKYIYFYASLDILIKLIRVLALQQIDSKSL